MLHTRWGGAFLKKKFLKNLVGIVKMIYLWWVGGLLTTIIFILLHAPNKDTY